ncbi:hypothetical protein [Prosthecobacter sp.]|uniref:hypothetical protein n=1 Tax=Prosthecobacter sp. TaxID=1965333 RepID=UPI00378342F0
MLSYRFCFYAIRAAPWVLGVGWFLNMLLSPGQSGWVLTPVEVMLVFLTVGYVLVGLVLGIKLKRGQLALMCPFCARPGQAQVDGSEELTMECPACGEIRGGGPLGWTIVRVQKKPKPRAGKRRAVPASQMQSRSPWFWGLFGLSVASAAAGAVIHTFSLFMVFGPLWCFLVGRHLEQTLRTGCLNDNRGPTFRSREPVKFWVGTCIWMFGCAFAVVMPLGFALQERGRIEEREAEAKAEMMNAERR